jgi:hypothetical protein
MLDDPACQVATWFSEETAVQQLPMDSRIGVRVRLCVFNGKQGRLLAWFMAAELPPEKS